MYQFLSKGQKNLWHIYSFYHISVQCFLPQQDATLQLATERDRLMSDPLLASVTFQLALGQTTIQVELEMMACLLFVNIEVEELNVEQVQYRGDLVDLL